MNIIIERGRLTKDVELRKTTAGKSVIQFTIAQNEKRGDKDVVYYFDCLAWDRTAESIAKFFEKGSEIEVIGKLTTRDFEKDGTKRKVTEIFVDRFEFCGKKDKKDDEGDAFLELGENDRMPF